VVPEEVPSVPVIAHYHGEHDERGFLFRSQTPALDGLLDRFNRRRAELTADSYDGIQRPPLRRRVRRRLADRFWAALADRAWYRSPRATSVRKRIKRTLASRS
jgi:hypothetical protein